MSSHHFTDLRAAARFIVQNERAREKRVHRAVNRAAREARGIVEKKIPRAFGELADSLDLVDIAPGHADVRVDAPYAAAVHNGSRPHTPPLAPLIAWVTLRGLQGLTMAGGVKSNRARKTNTVKDTRREAARVIAASLRNRLGRSGAAEWRQHMGRLYDVSADARANLAGAEADPAVVAIARAIQGKIAKAGTKPHPFVADSVEPTTRVLDRFVKEALEDQ